MVGVDPELVDCICVALTNYEQRLSRLEGRARKRRGFGDIFFDIKKERATIKSLKKFKPEDYKFGQQSPFNEEQKRVIIRSLKTLEHDLLGIQRSLKKAIPIDDMPSAETDKEIRKIKDAISLFK